MERRYAIWEKYVYGRVPVYNWTRTKTVTKPAVSLKRPTGENVVGTPERHVHHCASDAGTLADAACGGGRTQYARG